MDTRTMSALAIAEDQYLLEDVITDHPLRPIALVPFTVRRLGQGDEEEQEALLTVALENVQGRTETRTLRIHWNLDWSAAIAATQGVEEETITELAACGVACVLLARYTEHRLWQLPGRGWRFDYWVIDPDGHLCGLEASGVWRDPLRARHQSKRGQLLSSPARVGGYVVVVRFVSREAILSFHAGE